MPFFSPSPLLFLRIDSGRFFAGNRFAQARFPCFPDVIPSCRRANVGPVPFPARISEKRVNTDELAPDNNIAFHVPGCKSAFFRA